ncbi:MAG: tetraacyldisaccharide 4'-kinase [Dysgonamonadaceae bacterium]|jgi:tetraacyldisaccharide 4'-kinase|nr:tetraacyldisaccharide 4'-kinase [Dysgonamonadaceae bacterium]
MTINSNIKKILSPLSWLYGISVELRNKLFDRRLLPVETFAVPVLSVGNLAAGGTGKTPHTEYLVRLLSKRYKVAVLSRGYRRKTRGFVLAGADASAQVLGDEPFQMYRKFPDLTVAVDENRRRGIRNLLNLPEAVRPEVVLLDDAYQHRYVQPSLSILLTDSRRPFYEDRLLPAGRLREPAKNSARADIIICTKCAGALPPDDYRTIQTRLSLGTHQQLYFTSYQYKSLLPVFPESTSVKKESIERLKKEAYSFLLVTGIAHPEALREQLNGYTSGLQTLTYPDHYPFKAKDIAAITGAFAGIKNRNKRIITSEKDAVRLMDSALFPEEIKPFLYYWPVEVVFGEKQEALFIQKIEDHVRNFKRNRILA